MTDSTDPAARQNHGTPELDAVPTEAGQQAAGAINGQPSPEVGSARILGDLNGKIPHPPAHGPAEEPAFADDLPPGDPAREFPDWLQKMQEISRAGRFLIWLAGARHQILSECPTELPKYTGLGLTVLIPGVMAAVSMAFALVTTLRTHLWVALLFAVAWAAAIASLDRMFVASLPRKGTRQAQIFRAIPRFTMSLLLGFVISTPFVLQIFRPEIINEIQQLQAADRAAYYLNLPKNPVFLTVQRDQATVNSLTEEAATGGPGINLSQDPEILAWDKQLATARNSEQTWLASLQCQLSGTAPSGGKCVQGAGPLAADDQQEYNYWKGQVNTLEQEIQQRTHALQAQSKQQQLSVQNEARGQLPVAKQSLSSAQQQLVLQTDNVTASINADSGLLTQLRALSIATAGNSTLEGARILLFALFVVIDLMPVMIKVMLNLSPENQYDTMLEAEEELQLRSAALRRAARLSASEAETTAWTRVRQEKLRKWEAEQLQGEAEQRPPSQMPSQD